MFEFLIKKSYKISNWLWLLLGIIILTICILYITLHKKPSYTNSNGNGATSTTNDKIKSGNETSGTTTIPNTVTTTAPTTKVTNTNTAPTTTPTPCSDITSYCNSLGGTKPTTCNWITGSSWDFPINHKLDCPARCFCAMYNGSTDNITGKKLDLSNTICQTHYDGYSEAGCSLQPVTTPKPTTTPSTASCTDIASYCNSLDGTNPTTCNWFVARENSQWDNPKNHNLNCPARCFCAIYNASRDDIAGGKIYASNTSCQTNYTGYSAAGCT